MRIASVTSIALERDSRTLKMAASIARLGYESIVLEGERSRTLPDTLPFEVVSTGGEAGAPLEAASVPSQPSSAGRALGALPAWISRCVRTLAGPPYAFLSYLRDFLSRNREALRALPEADAYYLHGFFQAPAVWWRCRRSGAVLMYDSPDAYWEPDPAVNHDLGGRLAFRLFEAVEKRCARAPVFTSIGEGVAGLIERRHGRRPAVVRNCHELRLDRPGERGVRDASGVPDNALLLVTIGNAKPADTIKEVLAALRELPERVHLAFVGRGWERLTETADLVGIEPRVHFLPPVPPSEVAPFISSADVALVLYRALSENYRHALPNRFFHGVAAGLPILYSREMKDVGALADRYGLGLAIDSGDPSSIAAAVDVFLADPERLTAYRAAAERARLELNWEHEERVLASLLQEVMETDPRTIAYPGGS